MFEFFTFLQYLLRDLQSLLYLSVSSIDPRWGKFIALLFHKSLHVHFAVKYEF